MSVYLEDGGDEGVKLHVGGGHPHLLLPQGLLRKGKGGWWWKRGAAVIVFRSLVFTRGVGACACVRVGVGGGTTTVWAWYRNDGGDDANANAAPDRG